MSKNSQAGLKVVAHLRDGKLIKGYFRGLPAPFEALSRAPEYTLPNLITIEPEDSVEGIQVCLDALKALFFVKSFDGKRDYQEVKFFDKAPPIRGLWVRLQFYDNETFEGVVENSLGYVIEPGFFMKPPDPRGNNEILYVVKGSLASFRVLGLRLDF